MEKNIVIKGAREHNLKNIDVTIPRDKMVVLTGLSGSGKSSLAFDTIYAEGQKKYVESLSSYARQFLGLMKKPDVQLIEGLSPAISIDQKTTNKNPRSTVGTVTESYDYLRLMYARIGIPHCPVCGRVIESQSIDSIIENIQSHEEGTRLTVFGPVIRGRKGEHKGVIDRIRRDGYTRVRVDGGMKRLDEGDIVLEKNNKHSIDIVVDRIVLRADNRSRIAEALELAIKEGEGICSVLFTPPKNNETQPALQAEGADGRIVKEESAEHEQTYSTKLSCPEHGVSMEEMEPRMFSFNAPYGACPHCSGLGFTLRITDEAVVADPNKSLLDGAMGNVFSSLDAMGWYRHMLNRLAIDHHTDLSIPYKDQPEKFKDELLHGTGTRKIKYTYTSRAGRVSHMNHTFEGVIPNLERRWGETGSDYIKEKITDMMTEEECPVCHGKKLKDTVLAVTVGGKNIIGAGRDTVTVVGATVPDGLPAMCCGGEDHVAAGIGNMDQGIAGEALDSNGAVVARTDGIGESMDVGQRLSVAHGGGGTVGLQPHVSADIDNAAFGMDGEGHNLVRSQRAVGCGEVMELFQAVGRNEIEAVVGGAHPLAVGAVHSHAGDALIGHEVLIDAVLIEEDVGAVDR